MKRKIDGVLDNWLNNRKQAILLFGARQTGKTYSIRECFKRNNVNYLEINFATDKLALELFSKLKNAEDFYTKLSLFFNENENVKGVFLDEIQLVYKYRESLLNEDTKTYHTTIDPITLIKTLVEDGKYRFALSGSLLGVNLSGISSNPVGYLDTYTMYPLDFEEFLWARNIGNKIIQYLKKCFDKLIPIDDSIHQKLLSLFQEYLLVGGMPEAVSTYVINHNLQNTLEVQRQILNGYKNDILKYAPDNEKILIHETFANLPSELNRKDKHFRKSKLDYPNSKNIDLNDAFLWLTNAGVALPTYNVYEPTYPLKLNEDRKILKLFSNDIGLLSSQLFDQEGEAKILQGELDINFGAPFENFAAQELNAKGYSLYYYNSKKFGEVDFLIQKQGNVIPLEIKSGKAKRDGTFVHPALDNVFETYKDIQVSYVFSKENISKENNKIIYLPIYFLMFF